MRLRTQKTIWLPILMSIFGHTLVWFSLQFSTSSSLNRPQPKLIEVEFTDSKNSSPLKSQQIVDQDKALNNEIDEKAKYLSAFNQKVERETRAQNQGQFKNSQSKGAKTSAPSIAPTLTPQQKTQTAQVKRGEIPSLSSLSPQFTPPQPQSIGDLGQGQESSQTEDYLRDVETDMQTRLSTREFIYYTYYTRIKDRLRQHWEPAVRGKVKMIYRQGRTIASTKDHITQVVITLNRVGELVNVEVVTPSGMTQLDEAAIEAFRAAQPFPNPPKGLINEEGEIQIRWDFVLEANNKLIKKSNFAKGVGDESHPARGL